MNLTYSCTNDIAHTYLRIVTHRANDNITRQGFLVSLANLLSFYVPHPPHLRVVNGGETCRIGSMCHLVPAYVLGLICDGSFRRCRCRPVDGSIATPPRPQWSTCVREEVIRWENESDQKTRERENKDEKITGNVS